MAGSTLVVSEVYSPVFQGEGPSMGRRAGFIRLMGCNLHCVWCDSAYTWDASRFDLHREGSRWSVEGLIEQAMKDGPEIVVITGGEPLLHQGQDGWEPLLAGLRAANAQIEIETNGTVAPTDVTRRYVSRFNVSPKLAHGGDPRPARIRPDVLSGFAQGDPPAAFKFVARWLSDLDEVASVVREAGIPDHQVWIMPEGVDAETICDRLAQLADAVVARGWNLTTRLHILAYGDKRGV